VQAIKAGIVWINCAQPSFIQAPWGGIKRSGFGRELGEWYDPYFFLNHYGQFYCIQNYILKCEKTKTLILFSIHFLCQLEMLGLN